jgi:hypothetical protein
MLGLPIRLHRRNSIFVLLSSVSLVLTACGGGNGGGGGGGGGARNPNFGDAGAFQTDEFLTSDALLQINTDLGYASIPGEVGGDGVRVAVIDDGVDATHVDLDDGRVLSEFQVAGNIEIDSEIDPLGPDGHGTAVAGVIAGEKNDIGVHGVAFDASIVSFDVFSVDPVNPSGTDIVINVANAVRTAGGVQGPADGEVDIMNMSLQIGSDGSQAGNAAVDDVQQAMVDAFDRDKIIVVAAGNSAGDEVVLPAFFVDLPVSGLGIAVGSVDANNNISSFSNRCGLTAEFCMVAPGEAVDVPLPGDNFGQENGTSFSAPLVAGAAALVRGAFPGVSNREIVNRLLTTATDLGAPGIDPIFGQGLLNVDAAINVVGGLSATLGTSLDGEKVAIDDSQISLDSSLALGGDAATLLADAIVFDDQNFPFAVDLNRNVDRRSRSTGLDGFIGADRSLTTIQTAEYGSVSLALNEDQATADPYRAAFEKSDVDLTEEKYDPKVRFQSELGEGVDMFMSLNGTGTTDIGLGQALAAEEGAFFQQNAFLAPYERLAGLQSGGGAAYELSDDTKIAVSAFAAADDDALTQVNMQKVELMHRMSGDIEVRAGYGLLQEEGGFLGSATKGAFGAGTSTDTQYMSVSLRAPITEKLSLFGAYSQGTSSTTAGASLLDNFSTTRSEAFGAGLVMQDLVKDGDGFSVMVGQPLRVTSGSADITVPVGRTEDGKVLTEKARADLAPDVREITSEAVYSFALDDADHHLSTGAFVRFNPDNDPNASPDVGFGIKYQLRF